MMADHSGRVLHVISGIDVGGAENHLLTLCRGLVDRGFDITVAYLKGSGELAADFRAAGCTVVPIGIRTDADLIGFARLATHIVRRNYDIVHGHLFHGNVYGVTAATLATVPVIVSSKHNDPPFWEQQPYQTIHNLILRKVARVFPISDHVKRYLLRTTSVPPNRVETIRYGLDPTPFNDMGDVASVQAEFPGEMLVGTVARLTEQKDLETLIRAFARLVDSYDAHLAIVGRGDQRARLEQLAASAGIADDVTLTGFREDIARLMHAFDVFALPSRWEGFGIVFLEAMAAGTPIVASNTSAIPEIVADGETGFLCPPGDVDALANAIARLLCDAPERERLGTAGRRRLDSEFSVDRMVDEMTAAYDSLLDNST